MSALPDVPFIAIVHELEAIARREDAATEALITQQHALNPENTPHLAAIIERAVLEAETSALLVAQAARAFRALVAHEQAIRDLLADEPAAAPHLKVAT